MDFGRQLGAGLAHLHRAGVAHRDVKLANALLFRGGGEGGGMRISCQSAMNQVLIGD